MYIKKKAEKFYHLQIYNTKNVKENSLVRSMMIPDGNLDLHKGKKRARNGKYVDTNKRYLILKYI